MRILLLSTVLYLTGIAVMLYVRPAFMFHADGRSKEFGADGGADKTVLPFWLYSIVLAFVAYYSAQLILGGAAAAVAAVTVAAGSRGGVTTTPDAQWHSRRDEDLVDPLPLRLKGGGGGGRSSAGRRRHAGRKYGALRKGMYFYVGGGNDSDGNESVASSFEYDSDLS
jgi:hypothetical protein